MAQNIVVGLFEVESEAYQAMTELKQNPGDEKSYVSTAALVKKENGSLRTLDASRGTRSPMCLRLPW